MCHTQIDTHKSLISFYPFNPLRCILLTNILMPFVMERLLKYKQDNKRTMVRCGVVNPVDCTVKDLL